MSTSDGNHDLRPSARPSPSCPLWFNSTSSSIKKLKASYTGVTALLIVKPYSAKEVFVMQNIPSVYE